MEEKINLELPLQAVQTIINALAELPYKVSVVLISDILAQIQAQQHPNNPEEHSGKEE